MGGISSTPVEDVLIQPSPARKTQPAAKKPVPAKRQPQKPAAVKPVHWEYLLVSFQEYHGWRPRFINGKEQANWVDAPVIHEYIQQLGKDGWELAGASAGRPLYGRVDDRQVFFKRSK